MALARPLESHESYTINGHFHYENQITHHKIHFHNRNDLSDDGVMSNKPRWTGLIRNSIFISKTVYKTIKNEFDNENDYKIKPDTNQLAPLV